MGATVQNRYLQGPYGPVSHEVTAFDLPVEGEIPAELEGRYLRNGPNPLTPPDPTSHHWFIGDGMVHGIRLRDGRAEWYRNRWVGSPAVNAPRGLPDVEGPNWSGSTLGPNTHVVGFAGETWALVEAGGTPVRLDFELATIGRDDFGGTLPGAFSAHPKYDARTGEMHAVAYAWPQWMDHVQYIVVGADKRVRRTVDIPVPGMTMVHDLSLTDRYAVIYDQPVTVDIAMALEMRFPFAWNPDYGNRVGLLPREGDAGDIVWIDVPLGYCFHPLNAFDSVDPATGGDRVVLDLCVYPSMFESDLLGPFGEGCARLERWTVDPVARSVSVDVVDERANEFPRLRGSLSGRPYRFGYCASPDPDSMHWPTLKHDLERGTTDVIEHGPGRAGGEAVFVSRENSTAEDDGWLMLMVHEAAATDLVIIDAQEPSRGPVATVRLPQRVPFGFHGSWVPDSITPPG
jgi:8'-apo-carotenoid 13,14-cleaving dioxygenase